MKTFYLFITLLFLSFIGFTQPPTVGLLHHNASVSEGYTLFTPEKNNFVYLINNCGEKVNQWTFNENPGATCYLLPNGNLLRAGKDSLQIRDWNNNVVWSYATSVNNIAQHHDIEPLPNGNILCVSTDVYSSQDIINAGRNPSTTDATFKLDKIIELQPLGSNSANIVWEWKFIDHLIQDFDNTKSNYGTVINHPELIDINFDNGFTNDWTHVNSIDYNANLDQIIISVRHLNEIIIIDHSTTTLEAAGHAGGVSNLGGDILWRWGNPIVYRQGTLTDQKLFLQHDAKWVEPGYLDEGKITVFNNGGDGSFNYSSIHLINPEIVNGVYTKQNSMFNPINYEWSWNGSILGHTVIEDKKSGAHGLPNGNFIICETSLGQVSEINKNGDLLWSYKNPSTSFIVPQYSTITLNGNSLFRAEKYPENYIGFSGISIISQGILENTNTNSDLCINSVGINTIKDNDKINFKNPVSNGFISFFKEESFHSITIYDINGRLIQRNDNFVGKKLKINLLPGLYFLNLVDNNSNITNKIIVQ